MLKRAPRPARHAAMAATRRERLVAAARERLVVSALELRPGGRFTGRMVRFRLRCAELLLRLAEGA